MANVKRGEIELSVERGTGDVREPKTYTLKLSMNAVATLESKLKKKMSDILNEASSGDFTMIREVVFVLLQKYHAADFKTVHAAGDLIDDAGGIQVFFETLTQIIAANNQDVPEGSTANPPTAQEDGTSDASSLRLVESA